MKISKLLLLLILLINLFSTTNIVKGETEVSEILIVYSGNNELTAILNSFQSLSLSTNIDLKLIDELSDTNFQIYDLVIFSSLVKFDFPESEESSFIDFLEDPSKDFVGFSPHMDEFEDEIVTLIGFEKIDDITPEDNSTTWTLKVDEVVGNLSIGQSFAYTGQYAEITPIQGVRSLVSVISGELNQTGGEEEDDKIEFPAPAIINATSSGAKIISSTLSVLSTEVAPFIHLNQLPQIFDLLISQILSSIILEVNLQKIVTGQNTSDHTNNSDVSDNPTETDQNNIIDQTVPGVPNLQIGNLLFYGVLLIITLFISKILGVLGWINRKIIGIGIFIISAFYNVEDRILDQKDVYLNNSRAEIMDFLDTVGKFGSHLREIKSITSLGSGSLLWHLKVLEDFNWIAKYRIQSYTVYVSHNFETSFDPYLKKLELSLQSKYTYELFEALMNISFSNSITVLDLQKQTEVPNKAIRRFVKKLEDMEIIKINHTKPIRFQIYNYSIFTSLFESQSLRKTYSKIDYSVNVSETE
ncbi:MAG: hypothetical protein ACW99A_03365 [Candidatus Kariarchaeaceae archaeon]